MALTKYKLGQLIGLCDDRNYDGKFTLGDVKGISTGKEFIDTKANMDGVSLASYKVVKHGEFAYVADTSRRGEKIAIAFNNNERSILISSIYTVFYIIYLPPIICLCISIVPNLTDMRGLIPGALQEKLSIGILCAILILNCQTLLFSGNMWLSINPW